MCIKMRYRFVGMYDMIYGMQLNRINNNLCYQITCFITWITDQYSNYVETNLAKLLVRVKLTRYHI